MATPITSSRWLRIVAVVCLVSALTVIIGYIGLRVWLMSFLHSPSLLDVISQKTSEAIGVEGAYMPLHWSGWSVYSDGYSGKGKPGAVIKKIQIEQIRGNLQLHGIRHRTWEISQVRVQRLDAEISQLSRTPGQSLDQPGSTEDATQSLTQSSMAKALGSPQSGTPTTKSFGLSDEFRLTGFVIQDCRLKWNSPHSSSGRLDGLRATIMHKDSGWVIRGSGGAIHQSRLPSLEIDTLSLRYLEPVLYVTEAQLELAESATLVLSGQASLDETSAMDLLATINEVPVGMVVPPDWRARIEGLMAGEARLTGSFGDLDKLTADGSVVLQKGVLHALPLLDNIATFTRTEQFRRISLQEAKCAFLWSPDRVAVTDLVLESEGLLRIEGGLTVVDDNLEGVFEVGVSGSTLRWIPGSRKRVFTVERNGYVWTTVKVTGPLDRLQEDLSPRLISAARDEVIESTIDVIERSAREVLENVMPLLPLP